MENIEDPSNWFAGDQTDKDRQVSNIIALLLTYEIWPLGRIIYGTNICKNNGEN